MTRALFEMTVDECKRRAAAPRLNLLERAGGNGLPLEMHEIPGQEIAKRALEIAAIGDHRILLLCAGDEALALHAAFASIGGDPARGAVQRDLCGLPWPDPPDMVVECEPTPDCDYLLPHPCAPAGMIKTRVENRRLIINNIKPSTLDAGALELLVLATAKGWSAPLLGVSQSVAATIARLECSQHVRRAHLAEALGYVVPMLRGERP